jgi:hypothetical protein
VALPKITGEATLKEEKEITIAQLEESERFLQDISKEESITLNEVMSILEVAP